MNAIRTFIRSIRYALRGLGLLLKTEQNFRIQVLAGVIVVVTSFIFPFEVWQKIVLWLMVAMVLILEAANSVFERLADAFKSRLHPSIKDMKDIMASTVFVAAIVAVIVGCVLYIPMIEHIIAHPEDMFLFGG